TTKEVDGNIPGDRQPEPCAFADRLGREKFLKNTPEVFARNAAAVVAHTNLEVASGFGDLDENLPARGVLIGIDGVDDQIGQYLTKPAGIAMRHRLSSRTRNDEGTLRQTQPMRKEGFGIFNDLRHREGLLLAPLQIAGVKFEAADVRRGFLEPLLGGAARIPRPRRGLAAA